MATTMCIGNLRSATDLWCAYTETKDKKNPAEKPSVLFRLFWYLPLGRHWAVL